METQKRGTLPSGQPSISALPQHMTSLQGVSINDSVDSNDSYQSQVPQPFYQASNRSDLDQSVLDTAKTTTGDAHGERPKADGSALKGDREVMNEKTYHQATAGNVHKLSHQFDRQLPLDMDNYHGQNVSGRQGYGQQNFVPGYGHGHNVGAPQPSLTSPPPQYNMPATQNAYVSDPYAHFGVPNGMGNYNNQNVPQNGGNNMNHFSPYYDHYGGGTQHNNVASNLSNIASQDSYDSRRNSEDSQNTGVTGLSSVSSSSFIATNVPQMKNFNEENQHRCKGTKLVATENHDVTTPSKKTSVDYGTTTPKAIDEEKILRQRNAAETAQGHQEDEKFNNRSAATSEAEKYAHSRNASLDTTPRLLRSRRGQSITPAEQVKNTTKWIEKIELTSDAGALQAIEARLQSPSPRAHNSLALISPVERDVFTSPTRGSAYNNQLSLSSVARPLPMSIYTNDGHSAQYKILTCGGTSRPTLEEALLPANLPFEEYCRKVRPDNHGVVRIRNIPYNVSRQEIMAFLGRNARLVSENEHEPVHIVMERVTSKTLDCFVEFVDFNEAVNAVQRFEANKIGGKGSRLGQRHVDVELSSQDDLMKELFPKAKNVKWVGGRPEIIPTDPNDKYNSGFAGFISKEELIMLTKHVEAPQRSPFSKDCPQRPFECLISTLVKYPWYAVDAITLNDRIRITEATKQLLENLYARISNRDMGGKESIHINSMLFKRVWKTCLACKGFSPMLKNDVVDICHLDMSYAQELGLVPNAIEWYPFWLIGPKPGVPMDVLNLYIGWIRDITTQARRKLSLAEQAALGGGAPQNEIRLFGDLPSLIHYPYRRAYYTLAQIAEVEWTGLEEALRRALTPALT